MSAIPANPGAAAAAAQPNRFNELDSQEFLGIILAEMQSQDPLAPNDTNALLDQLSSVRAIESDLQLTDRLEALVADNRLASAASLVGRRVEGVGEDRSPVAGRVQAVRTRQGEPVLVLETGQSLRLDDLTTIAAGSPQGTTP